MTVQLLSEDELWEMPDGARLAAMRWDLVPWALVLDLDVPETEAAGARMRRGWMIFDGVSEVTMSMDHARLPTGCWITGGLADYHTDGKFHEFAMWALLPQFDANDQMMEAPQKEIRIRALAAAGILSVDAGLRDEWGLSHETRIALASDASMLELALQTFGRGFRSDA